MSYAASNTLQVYKLLSCKHHLCTQIWGCSRDEANHVVHEFFKSQHFAVGVLPMPGMAAVVKLMHPGLTSHV